jgi:hypothetical protein
MITAEQASALAAHCAEWRRLQVQTGPIDREAVTLAVREVYAAVGRQCPPIEFVSSPLGLGDAVSSAVSNAVYGVVSNAVYGVVSLADSLVVSNAESLAVSSAVYDAEALAFSNSVYRAVSSAVSNAKFCAILFGNSRPWIPARLGAYREIFGCDLRKYPAAGAYAHYCRLAGPCYFGENRAVVCGFPDAIHLRADDQLHCENGPSISWPDGFAIWSLNGIKVDEQLVMRPETQTLKQIEAEGNTDVRAIRIARFGWPRYLAESGAKQIDAQENAVSGTPEALYRLRDGTKRLIAGCVTGKLVSLGVPDEVSTCDEAQRWLAGRAINVVAAT